LAKPYYIALGTPTLATTNFGLFSGITGVDQYLAVLDPLEYNAKVTRGVSWKLIALVWTLGFSAAVAASTQLVSAANRSPWTSCREAAGMFDWNNQDKVG
jgi:hypothetical protein